MHENFLSYIMIGLSRGLFPSATTYARRPFDEEAYLREEAALLRREKRVAAARQQSTSAEHTGTAMKAEGEEPGGRQPVAFSHHALKVRHSCAGLAGSEPCRAA